jgi:hypothetical protein
MGTPVVGAVGLFGLAEGQLQSQFSLGREGQQHVDFVHGQYFSQTRRGNVYTYNSGAAGLTILKYDNTTPALVLWNKSTGCNLELINLTVTWVGTPAVAGSIGFARCLNVGTTVSAAQISAFTELATAIRENTWAASNPPNGKVATSSTIVARAAADVHPILSFPDALAAASTTVGPFLLSKDFRGEFIVPPTCALVLCGNVAQSQAMGVTLTWVDNVPV